MNPGAEARISLLPPVNTQESLTADRSPSIRGRITGTCRGAVLLQASSPNQERPLAALSTEPGDAYVFVVPGEVPLTLSWGCDGDRDGVVPSRFVSEAQIGSLTRDLPLDLSPLDHSLAARDRLTTARTRSAAPLPAHGALASPTTAAPPEAAASPDGAVGPPLPEGPPADAGPPPTGASGPPL